MAESLVDLPELRVVRLVPDAQLLLHGDPEDAASLSEVGSIALSDKMLRTSTNGGWNALHLAPDEWLLIGPLSEAADVAARFAETSIPRSLVDIGERSLGVEISGSAAAMLLNTGCPLDFDDDVFPTGTCTRTLFGKVSVMIWRMAHTGHYRMQYGRSFDDYVTTYIATAAIDVGPSAAPPRGDGS